MDLLVRLELYQSNKIKKSKLRIMCRSAMYLDHPSFKGNLYAKWI